MPDILTDAKTHLEALRSAAPRLKEEREICVKRIVEIDTLLGSVGDAAKPRRGRPRRKKEEAADAV